MTIQIEADGFPCLEVDHLPPDRAMDRLLDQANWLGASDLFFATNRDHVCVRLRHLGILRPLAILPLDMGQRCITHIKAMAEMNVADHRRPMDGRWIYQIPDGGEIDLRVNTIPTLHGEDCSLRLLTLDSLPLSAGDLGLLPRQLNDLLAMLNTAGGLILVTGPTGAGKTTTLYTCLRDLNNGERKINTIEDPIEYEVPGLRQSQIQPRIDLGFPELLRSVLRQAPDVIMIGEIRDATTAATAVHAANSGHLVLATVHAPVAVGAVQTMRAWGVHPHFLAGSLLGVLAQRLIRTLCPACRTFFPVSPSCEPFAEVQHWLKPDEGHQLPGAHGCAQCHGTGYDGRTGVFEVLRVSDALRRLIADGQSTSVQLDRIRGEGQIELRQAALLKVAQGQTTIEEVVRAIPPECLGLE
jgi:type II secretory ATPase GspE/PulE/Tfp pilus assembly ATPase PilB-like protein